MRRHACLQRLHNSIDVNAYHYYTELLSPALKAKLLLYMNRNWITRVPHFQGVSQTFIVRVRTPCFLLPVQRRRRHRVVWGNKHCTRSSLVGE